MSGVRPLSNPYARARPFGPLINRMGRQSQQRVSNTKRAFQLAQYTSKKKPRQGGQLTLQGEAAFEPEKDCRVCKAQALARAGCSVRIPKRSHHPLCARNTTTKGKGIISQQNILISKEEARLKDLFSKPLAAHEKGSWKHATPEAGVSFFAARKKKEPTPTATTKATPMLQRVDFCGAVSDMVEDSSFQAKHKAKNAPLAMVAFASEVVEKVVHNNKDVFDYYFNGGLSITVPDSPNAHNNPHYHSIVGQKLFLVDWRKTCGISPACPDRNCNGAKLINQRTNFSKTYFPICFFFRRDKES